MQSLIQGSITIKNLSFEGKEIIKALLEQGINVDVDGEFLRIDSKLIKSSPEPVMAFSSKNESMNAVNAGVCPFYRNFELFSEKIDRLYDVLRGNGLLNRADSRENDGSSKRFYRGSGPIFGRGNNIYDFKKPVKPGIWNIPEQDLQKTQDFLYADRSVRSTQEDTGKLFSNPFLDSFDQLGGKTCNHCGSPLSKNGFFCNLCGNKVESDI